MNQNTSASDELDRITIRNIISDSSTLAYMRGASQSSDSSEAHEKYVDRVLQWHNAQLAAVLRGLLEQTTSYITDVHPVGNQRSVEAVPTEVIQAELDKVQQ